MYLRIIFFFFFGCVPSFLFVCLFVLFFSLLTGVFVKGQNRPLFFFFCTGHATGSVVVLAVVIITVTCLFSNR